MRTPRFNDNVTIHFEKLDGEYVMAGKWMGEDEGYVSIEGTVGKHIGERMYFPKSRVVFIEVHGRISGE